MCCQAASTRNPQYSVAHHEVHDVSMSNEPRSGSRSGCSCNPKDVSQSPPLQCRGLAADNRGALHRTVLFSRTVYIWPLKISLQMISLKKRTSERKLHIFLTASEL